MAATRLLRWTMIAVGLLALLPRTLHGQAAANTGQVVGQVVDSSGAALSGVAISVRNRDTNHLRRTKTDAAGRFAVTLLPPGAYEIVGEGSGFAPSKQDLAVSMGGSIAAKLTLGIQPLHTSVDVNAEELSIDPGR